MGSRSRFSNRFRLTRRLRWLLAALALVVLVGGVAAYSKLRDHQSSSTSPPPPMTEPVPPPTDENNLGGTSTTPPPVAAKPTSPPAAATPAGPPKPTGQVLNKHEVHLSDPDPASQYGPGLVSTCRTVPDAACGVRATMGATVIDIPAQPVNDRGELEIDWNAKDRGLSAGTWQIQVVATRSGGSTASDADNLVVTQ